MRQSRARSARRSASPTGWCGSRWGSSTRTTSFPIWSRRCGRPLGSGRDPRLLLGQLLPAAALDLGTNALGEIVGRVGLGQRIVDAHHVAAWLIVAVGAGAIAAERLRRLAQRHHRPRGTPDEALAPGDPEP